MKKKILLFVSIISLIMLFGINTKAATSCSSGVCNGGGSCGSKETKEYCEANSANGCSWACSSCTNGGTPNGSGCVCNKPSTKPVIFNGCAIGTYSKNSDGCDMRATNKSSGLGLVCTSGDTSMARVSVNGDKCHISPVGSPTTPNCKKEVTITLKFNKACGSEGDTSTAKVTIETPWNATPTRNVKIYRKENTQLSRPTAEKLSLGVAFENCQEQGSGNSKYWLCDRYNRGCGKKPPNPEPHCYKNTSTGLLYWGVYSTVKDGEERINNGYEIVNSITDPKQCVSKFQCTTEEPKASGSTVCNGQGKLEGTYKRKCEAIYTIECKDTIETHFQGPSYDWTLEEGHNAYLYPGTGFKYKFSAFSDFKCTGYFDKDRYEKVSKYITEYASKISGNIVSLDGEFYSSASDGLNYIKTSYTEWDPNYIDESTVTIRDDLNGTTLRSVDLVPVELEEGEDILIDKCGKLPKDKSGSVKTDNFTYTERRYMEKEIPMAYLNNKGEIIYEPYSCDNCDLGKQFFITEDRNNIGSTKYNYIVNAEKLGYLGFGTDETKCNLQVVNNELIYRHVDLNDPFIKNSGHKIGQNWLNSRYDFTKILKPNVWTKDSMYNTVTLTKDINAQIKKETSNNPNYYIGACTRGNASSADIVCSLLKQAQK